MENGSKLDNTHKKKDLNCSSKYLFAHAFSVSKKTAPLRTLQEVTEKLKLEYKRSETPLLFKPSDEEHEAVYIGKSNLRNVAKWLNTNEQWTSKRQSLETLFQENCSFKSTNSAFKEVGDSKRVQHKKHSNRMHKINMYGENHNFSQFFKTKST